LLLPVRWLAMRVRRVATSMKKLDRIDPDGVFPALISTV
jgi:hypothetical protein